MDNLVNSPEIIGAIIGGVFLLLTTLIGGWFNVRAAQIRAETERAARSSRARPRKTDRPAGEPEKRAEKRQKLPLPAWLLATGAVLGAALLFGGLVLSGILPILPPATPAAATGTEAPSPTTLPGDTPVPTINASVPLGFPGNPVTANNQWKPITHKFGEIEMVLVPAGRFTMGSDDNRYPDEQPPNQQSFDQPFWIGRTEVTNAQYDSGGSVSGDNLPRDQVLWREAAAFCDNWGARLPTEAEWEYAARGPDNRVYPWGDVLSNARAVYRDSSDNRLWPVASKPAGASWVGALDMSGNVWEWTSSLYKPYPYDDGDGRESSTWGERVIRGGSFEVYDVRASRRYGREDAQYVSVGFRCARDWSPSDPTQ